MFNNFSKINFSGINGTVKLKNKEISLEELSPSLKNNYSSLEISEDKDGQKTLKEIDSNGNIKTSFTNIEAIYNLKINNHSSLKINGANLIQNNKQNISSTIINVDNGLIYLNNYSKAFIEKTKKSEISIDETFKQKENIENKGSILTIKESIDTKINQYGKSETYIDKVSSSYKNISGLLSKILNQIAKNKHEDKKITYFEDIKYDNAEYKDITSAIKNKGIYEASKEAVEKAEKFPKFHTEMNFLLRYIQPEDKINLFNKSKTTIKEANNGSIIEQFEINDINDINDKEKLRIKINKLEKDVLVIAPKNENIIIGDQKININNYTEDNGIKSEKTNNTIALPYQIIKQKTFNNFKMELNKAYNEDYKGAHNAGIDAYECGVKVSGAKGNYDIYDKLKDKYLGLVYEVHKNGNIDKSKNATNQDDALIENLRKAYQIGSREEINKSFKILDKYTKQEEERRGYFRP